MKRSFEILLSLILLAVYMYLDQYFNFRRPEITSIISLVLLGYITYFAFFVDEHSNNKYSPSNIISGFVLGHIIFGVSHRSDFSFFELVDIAIVILLFLLLIWAFFTFFVNDDVNDDT